MFESSPNPAIRFIGAFCSLWFYGHGWFAPLYYGALFAFALWLRKRFELAWHGNKPILFFVIGVSMSYGALCAALLSMPFLFMTPLGGINPIFLVLFAANIYACQALIRSVIWTYQNKLDKAFILLRRGLVVVAPSIFLLVFFASSFVRAH